MTEQDKQAIREELARNMIDRELARPKEYNPCEHCQYFGKPYWSVVSPCETCSYRYNTGGYVTTTSTALD